MQVDGIEQLDADEAERRREAGAGILDVREPAERAAVRIPGSVSIPLSRLAEQVNELDPARPWVIQCMAGHRSQQAALFLQQQGFAVANLMHGLVGWYRMGKPTDTAPE